MKVSKIATAIALLGMAVPAVAQAGESAKAVGRVAAATDGVFIARDGKLIPASTGQALFKGDRVVTRAKATAKVTMAQCNVAMAPTSIVAVGDTCAPAQTLAASSAGLQGANGLKGSTIIVSLLALTAIISGGIALSDGKKRPTSP